MAATKWQRMKRWRRRKKEEEEEGEEEDDAEKDQMCQPHPQFPHSPYAHKNNHREKFVPQQFICYLIFKGVDWWSLGILIYELSKGETPFAASPLIRMYQKIISNQYTMPLHFTAPLKVTTTT